jgi:hypothetical protein
MAVTAATSIAVGVVNYEAGAKAASAEKSLADSQAAQLTQEQNQANALAATEAASGQTFGFGSEPITPTIMTGLGFGTDGGGSAAPNSGGSKSVTGMS